MSKGLEIDFETRSDIGIRTRGAYVYFESPTTKPLMASYILNGGKTQRWLPHEPCPADIRAHVEAGGMVVAHNMGFERGLWQKILTPLYGWPVLRLEQCRCTLATASALGLPRSLDKLGAALNLPVQKDKIGKELIRFFCVPRKPKKDEPEGLYFNEPDDFPEKFEQFRFYCDKDVETEAEADKRMISLSADEQAVWVLDQQINDRGIRIDTRSAVSAIRLIEKATAKMDAEMKTVTGGAVTACSQVAKLTAWVASRGVALEGVAKDDILAALSLVDLPVDVRRALELRQEAGKASTSKLKGFLNRVCADGRIRGWAVYHGAAPGRWSSTGVNMGNLMRPDPEFADAKIDPAVLHEAFRTEDPDYLKFLFGPKLGRPLHLVASAMRSFVIAAPGHRFIAADYSNIQGAICAWLAGEEWKVQAMREIFADPKNVPDLYRRTAAKIMNLTTDIITKKHPLRQSVGKVSELSLQFGGGCSAFHSMSLNYNVNLNALYEPVWGAADEATRSKAVKSHERALKSKDKRKADILTPEAWVACEIIKVGWRAGNPRTVKAWDALEDAARGAVQNPGVKHVALDKVVYLCAAGYLWCQLPSGRCIAYSSPKLKDQVWARLRDEETGEWLDQAETMDRDIAERLALAGKAKIDGACKSKITALGVDSSTQKWVRYPLYGGLFMENCLDKDTQVLTDRGWVRIVEVARCDKLWDGVAWVKHAGLLDRGVRGVMDFDGVLVTPEHKIWTGYEWEDAQTANIHTAASASPLPESHGPDIRSIDSREFCWRRREEKLVEYALRLWLSPVAYWCRAYERANEQLRLFAEGVGVSSVRDAQIVGAPGVSRLEVDARQMPITDSQSVQELRWPGLNRLPAMAGVRKFLARYGGYLRDWVDHRASRQRKRVLAGELPVEGLEAADAQQAQQRHRLDPERRDVALRSFGDVLNLARRILLPYKNWLARTGLVRPPVLARTEQKVAVFDILEAGPRHRFTVRGREGRTFIVSNCCLAIERDILVQGFRNLIDAGYNVPALHVYDEAVVEEPYGFGSVEEVERLLCAQKAWAAGIPIAASGFEAKRYKKD